MSNIWLTSDLHFEHNKPFLYEPRGFASIVDHDEGIIRNWNSIVAEDDTVYVLGDFSLDSIEAARDDIAQLKGNIKLIIGNHDSANRIAEYAKFPNIEILGYATVIKSGKWRFYLSHYPTAVGGQYNMRDKLWCLCGHSHTQDCWADAALKSYHVELDAHNNFPVSLEQIKQDIIEYKESMNENI